jgi:hypothetical protein
MAFLLDKKGKMFIIDHIITAYLRGNTVNTATNIFQTPLPGFDPLEPSFQKAGPLPENRVAKYFQDPSSSHAACRQI